MQRDVSNTIAYLLSILLHVVLVATFTLIGLFKGCHSTPDMVIPMDMTVVLDENLIESEDEPPQEVDSQPDIPPPPPIPVDTIVTEKKVDKPKPEKPKPPKPPKPFVKGRRVTVKDAPKPTNRKKTPTERALSPEEIRRLLNAGARPGSRNQVAPNEESRCLGLIKGAFYEAWVQPGDCPRPALLQITFNRRGEVTSYRLTRRSGSAEFDSTVLRAAAEVPRVSGLSQAFLAKYATVTIEFKIN